MINLIRSRYESLNIVTKASIAYILVGLFQKALSLLSGAIFTRMLNQDTYGLLSAYVSWYEMIGVIAMLSLSAGVYNNGLADFGYDKDVFTCSLLILSNLVSVIVICICFVLKKTIIEIFGFPSSFFIVMAFCYMFSPALGFWSTRKRYEYRYKSACIVNLCSSFLAFCLSIIVTYYSDKQFKLIGRIWSEKLILLVFWLVIYMYILYKAKFKIKIQYWKYALRFSIPLIPHYLSNYVLSSADRLMIINMVGASEAAIYTVSYSIAFIVQFFWQSINGAILPITYQYIKEGKESKIQSKVIPLLLFYSILCITVAFIAPELMCFFAPMSYWEGVYIIPILGIGTFLMGMYCLFANVEFYYKSTKAIALNSIFAAVLNIILNYIFIPYYGYAAAAYTTTFSYLVQTLLHYVNYRRVSKRIYKDRVLLTILLGTVMLCMFCILLYSYIIIRYVIIFLMLTFGVVKRKCVMNYIEDLDKH